MKVLLSGGGTGGHVYPAIAIANKIKEENPDWDRIWGYNPNPNNPHEFGECMEDWHDYEWRKEQEEMDHRRKDEEWEKWLE